MIAQMPHCGGKMGLRIINNLIDLF